MTVQQQTIADIQGAVHATLCGGTFNATDLAFVVSSLPLGPGYKTQIPIYDPEGGGYRLAAVRATGKTAAGDAWLVSVSENNVALKFTIGVASRSLLEETIANPPTGYEFSMSLQPGKTAH